MSEGLPGFDAWAMREGPDDMHECVRLHVRCTVCGLRQVVSVHDTETGDDVCEECDARFTDEAIDRADCACNLPREED